MAERYNLVLSRHADADLAAIYEYGFRTWGEEQADSYYDDLLSHFDQLCDNPFLYAPIDDIRLGYRRSVCGVHSIYYRVVESDIQIMMVIGAQDIERELNARDL